MAKILHKRNNLTGVIPTTAELELGELALNTVDGKIFIKKNNQGVESITEIGTSTQTSNSELEKIIENGNTGWRLLDRDPSSYGNIGQDALDFSYNQSSSATAGATGQYSVAFGYMTTASGFNSFAQGSTTSAGGLYSHAEGNLTSASGASSHAEGIYGSASGEASHASGYNTTASGHSSHAEGYNAEATGIYGTHAEGMDTIASGNYGSHAEGYLTTASGQYGSHSEGNQTIASGDQSHAEGHGSEVHGNDSHAENHFSYVDALAHASHAEGFGATIASNYETKHSTISGGTRVIPPGGGATLFEGAHAEGMHTLASVDGAHAEGYGTIAIGPRGAHAEGQFNIPKFDAIHEVGIGQDNNNRVNAFEIYIDGRVHAPAQTLAMHTDPSMLTTKEYVDSVSGGGGGEVSQLEKLVVNESDAWRILGRDGNNYQDPGENSVDLSLSTTSVGSNGASGDIAFATGKNTEASGEYSTAMGYSTTASGSGSTSLGYSTKAIGYYSTSMGYYTTSKGNYSTSGGHETNADGDYSVALGNNSVASNGVSTTVTLYKPGQITVADISGFNSGRYITVLEGTSLSSYLIDNIVGNILSVPDLTLNNNQGSDDRIWPNNGNASFALGTNAKALGNNAFATGIDTYASSNPFANGGPTASHAEGVQTRATGCASHAEGHQTQATGGSSHAEGYQTIASGSNSHAGGHMTQATGRNTTAIGSYSTASGNNSFAAGYNTNANRYASAAFGVGTIAENAASFASGEYNIGYPDTMVEIGIGTNNSIRKNAFEVYSDGRIHAPDQTLALHDSPRSLATKEYVDSVASGGGSSTLADLTDTIITLPQDGDILVYDSSSSDWINTPVLNGGTF